MTTEFINPEALGRPRGYNNGVKVAGGNLLFVAGQIGWNHNQVIVSDDFASQFTQALENVITVVREAGGEPTNITRLLIFVTDKREYLASLKALGEAYRQLMGKHFPAMTLVEVTSLVDEGAKIEIEAIAVL
ncbi:MAG: RidA family protein [Acidobacteriota bacterium]